MRNRLLGAGLLMIAFVSAGVSHAAGFVRSGLEFTTPNPVQEYVSSITIDSMGNIYAVGWESQVGVDSLYAQKWTSSLQPVWRHDPIVNYIGGTGTRGYDCVIVDGRLVVVGCTKPAIDPTFYDGFVACLNLATGNVDGVSINPNVKNMVDDVFYSVCADPSNNTVVYAAGAFTGAGGADIRVDKYFVSPMPPTPSPGDTNQIDVGGMAKADYGYSVLADANYVFVGGKSDGVACLVKFNKMAAMPHMWTKSAGTPGGDGLHRLMFDPEGDVVGVKPDGIDVYHFAPLDGTYQEHHLVTGGGMGQPIAAGLAIDPSSKSVVVCGYDRLYVLDPGSFAQSWTTNMLSGSEQLKDLAFLPDGRLVTAGVTGGNPDAQVIIWDRASGGTITASPATLSFRVNKNAATLPFLTLGVRNSATTGLDGMVWTATSSVTWLTLSKTTGTLTPGSSDSFNVTMDQSLLNPGTRTTAILFAGSGSTNGTATVYVTATVIQGLAEDRLKIANNKLDMSDPNRAMYFMIKDAPNKMVKVGIYDATGGWIGRLQGTTDSGGVGEITFRNRAEDLSGGVVLGAGVYWAILEGSNEQKRPFMVTLGNR